jgi:hypothetical protein
VENSPGASVEQYELLASGWVDQKLALAAQAGRHALNDSKLGTFRGIEVEALVRADIMSNQRRLTEIEQRFAIEVQALDEVDVIVVTIRDEQFGGHFTRCHWEYFPYAGRESRFQTAREAWSWDPGNLNACAAWRLGERRV